MPENELPTDGPSPATLEAIVAAVDARVRLSPETMEGLRLWLCDQMAHAIQRARAKPLGRGDLDRLETAYWRFREVIAELQASDDPPPELPVADGEWTAWDQWLTGHRYFDTHGPRGRPEVREWRLIGALLAFYEIISGQRATAANERNETMSFLDVALTELANYVPSDLKQKFQWPDNEALKKQMPKLRGSVMPHERRYLKSIIAERR